LLTCGNISGGGDEQLARLAILIRFVTVERNTVPNAARKYTTAVGHNTEGDEI